MFDAGHDQQALLVEVGAVDKDLIVDAMRIDIRLGLKQPAPAKSLVQGLADWRNVSYPRTDYFWSLTKAFSTVRSRRTSAVLNHLHFCHYQCSHRLHETIVVPILGSPGLQTRNEGSFRCSVDCHG